MSYRFGAFELDDAARELRLNGREVFMQPRVFDLLLYLVQNRARVVGKEALLQAVWPDVIVSDGSLQRAVSLARTTLREGGLQDAIRNYPRQGYRFMGEVTEESAAPSRQNFPALAKARRAYENGDWATATETFKEADGDRALEAADLERWALAAQCAGSAPEAIEPLERAVAAHASRGDRIGSARAAIQLAQIHFENREAAVAKGWHQRALRFLSGEDESRERGLAEWIAGRLASFEGNLEEARERSEAACRIGQQLDDPDVEALGRLYWGLALLSLGDIRRGVEHLDEAAATVLGGGVSPWFGGLVYCGVIWGCLNRGDWQRASQWTDQFTRWCSESGMTAFPGLCRLHRAEVFSVRGELAEAERELDAATGQLATSAPWAEGEAYRVLGDIRLARGDLTAAETALRRAHELGWEPQPGWARLQRAQGHVEAAVRSLERALKDRNWAFRQRRGSLLAELAVAAALAGRVELARKALEELDQRPELWSTPAYEAEVQGARAELAHAEGKTEEAIAQLRSTIGTWQRVGSSLNAANARLRLAEILTEQDDPEGAELERSAAEAVFRKVGARARLEECRAQRTD